MRARQTPHLLLLLLLPLLTVGCASVKVTCERENTARAPRTAPTTIRIEPAWTMPGSEENLKKTGRTLYLARPGNSRTSKEVSQIEKAITDSTRKRIGKTLDTAATASPGLIVETQVTMQRKGSRALRALVGLGLGKTILETRTVIYDPKISKTDPWLEVWTSGGSNREPGMIFAGGPSPLLALNVAAAIGGTASLLSGASKGLTQDGKRTGRVIAKHLLKKLGRWKPPENTQPDSWGKTPQTRQPRS